MSMIIKVTLIVLCSLICLQTLTNAQGGSSCPDPNQEFKECGTACPAKCSDQGPVPCTLQCIQECQCKNGYVLNANGRCVSPSEC